MACRRILKDSFSLSLGLLAIMSFNLVDSLFLSQISESHLAAITLILPLTLVMGSLNFGMSSSLNALLSKFLGQRNTSHAISISTLVLWVNLLCTCTIVFFIGANQRPLLDLLNIPSSVHQPFLEYFSIWKFAIPFIGIPVLLNTILKARGNTFIPTFVIVFTSLLNIFLDYFFLKVSGEYFQSKMQAAALATFICRLVMSALLIDIVFKKGFILVSLKGFKKVFDSNLFRSFLTQAIPNSLVALVVPLSITYLSAMISKNGTSEIAVFGASSRIESIIAIIGLSLSGAVAPLIGNLYGEKKHELIKKYKRTAHKALILTSAITMFICLVLNQRLMEGFNLNAYSETINTYYLFITINLMLFLKGSFNIFCSFYNSISKAKLSMYMNFAHTLFTLIFFKIFASELNSVYSFYLSYATAYAISLVICLVSVKAQRYYYLMQDNYSSKILIPIYNRKLSVRVQT